MVFACGLCEVGSEAGRWLSGQGQSWTAKQDHAGEARVQAGCVDRGSHVGRVGLRMGLAVLLRRKPEAPTIGRSGRGHGVGRAQKCAGRRAPPALWADHQARLGAHLELLGTS